MSKSPPRLTMLVVSCIATAVLSACTNSAVDPVAASPSVTASSPAVGEPTASSAPSGSPSGSPSSSASASTANAVTIDITITDDQVSPNGDKVDVAKGQTVILKVSSDSDDEIHAHTGDDGFELEVKAGEPAIGEFVASDAGTFEVESHHLEKVIVRLVVR